MRFSIARTPATSLALRSTASRVSVRSTTPFEDRHAVGHRRRHVDGIQLELLGEARIAMHVMNCPLRPGPTQDEVRAVALAVGRRLAERAPELVTVEMSKAKRRGRVFADALRNAFGQTIAAPYSVRRRPEAPVSTPLDWDEVDPRLDPARWNLRTIEPRLAGRDPWSDFWKRRQALPRVAEDRITGGA